MKSTKKILAMSLCTVLFCSTQTMTTCAEAVAEKTDGNTPTQVYPVPVVIKSGSIESDSATIEYAVYGDENAEPLVLISGNGSDMHGLDGSVLPYLASHFMVITASNRGTGNSTRGEGLLTFDVMAKDLLNLIDYLGLDKINIFGFSDGGNLALVFAVNYPNRVKSVVSMSANINPLGTKITNQIGIVSNYFWKCVTARISGKPEDAVRRDIQGLMVWQPSLTFNDLKTITAPTLNIFGEHDMIKRVHSKMITKSISGAAELMIEGGGHGSCFEQTDTVIIPALGSFYGF